MVHEIRHCFYHSDHDATLRSFDLPKEQQRFTALPAEALKACSEEKERKPIVILHQERPVGFFVLHTGKQIRPFTDNPRAVLLRSFSINYPEQGKGFAKQALALLPAFVNTHFSDINEIVLAVNERNVAAQRLYLTAGFIDSGRRREGKKGRQLLLYYPLSAT
ncbi:MULTISPECIES: GNAT family N-acetyltransferase [Geobacillus]|uniref:GNAT family N-acetyltransferase n=1 Tax=Geobacillus TaxID=129337 RepID=UPI0009BD75DD|nr:MULTISPECIES: GNAT family protein [Geobacillus]OQP17559.1 GNAT family N-acetyltransferase [Geobacillus zalihae]RXS89734.1 GNAT family N-acetyltransferase [Geobacillus sp. PK12]